MAVACRFPSYQAVLVKIKGSLAGEEQPETTSLKEASIEYFVSFVQIFGLPKSVGQIYGLLFVSVRPLAMDEIVEHLGISKGSSSQGLTLLKGLGAVASEQIPGDRREHFKADINVSRIVTHFFDNQLQPRLDNGESRLKEILRLAQELEQEEGGTENAGVVTRIKALQKWQKRGMNIIPMVIRWLKR